MSSQNTQQMFNDSSFASRYIKAEEVTGMYVKDLLLQMGFSNSAPTAPISLLDLACGTGVASKHIQEHLRQAQPNKLAENKFTGADFAPAMLDIFKSRIKSEGWDVVPEFLETNMMDTKLPSGAYTHLVCSFGPTLTKDPDCALRESYRVLQPNGIAGWTGWQTVGWLGDMTSAFDDIRAEAKRKCDEGIGNAEDEKLGGLPKMPTASSFMAKMQGNDLDAAMKEGKAEAIPRWDQEAHLEARIRAAGFEDVKVVVVNKSWNISMADLELIALPVVKILENLWWSKEERERMQGVDVQDHVRKWFQQKFDTLDGGREHGKLVWDNCIAMLCTGRKSE